MSGYQKIKKDFEGKKVLVMGLGLLGGGVGVANFFDKLGSKVRVVDLKSRHQLQVSIDSLNQEVEVKLGDHDPEDFIWADVVIRNPAVPKDSKLLEMTKGHGVKIYMETALFAKYTRLPIIGVTGTRGKTTTTMMLYEVLKRMGKKVGLGGNAIRSTSLELLQSEENDRELTILELSSWQLQGFGDLKISPHLAVMTNIYPDHLNRYGSMDEYVADKKLIFKFQKPEDRLFVNKKDKVLMNLIGEAKSEVITYDASDLGNVILSVPGEHNRDNAAACLAIVNKLGVSRQEAIDILARFSGLAYRLEERKKIEGVSYINDTTSTTPIATITALKAIDQPTWLILGGNSKSLPTDELIESIRLAKNLKGILLIPGTGTDEIEGNLIKRLLIGRFVDLEAAVKKAKSLAKPGEVVMFSPGFTSFGQFNNEFERGDYFNKILDEL